MLRNNADARRCSYFELGLPMVVLVLILAFTEYTLSDELENGLPVHMNLLGILSLPQSTCVT